MSQTPIRKIKCPQCKTETVYSADNPHRPFCSERCRCLDLGDWADENFRIPVSDQRNEKDWNPSHEDGENEEM